MLEECVDGDHQLGQKETTLSPPFLKFDSECKECARIWLLEEAEQLDFRKIM